ncbi:MAG TPA: alpha-ketoglutarate-dependent dioxygenase AlkB [Hyphomicrobiaceae bacterium]|jgi:alkylated DNA repair protein (DNA oxidative demethylase)
MTLSGFKLLTGYFDAQRQAELLRQVEDVVRGAPFYRPTMPRSGKPLSVEMSNAGKLGWVTDKQGGYRYQRVHPVTGQPWPAIPDMLMGLWKDVAEYPAPPEACLINLYGPGSKLGSHVDADEKDSKAPVVSVSLGDDAIFHIGGPKRSDPKTRLHLQSGDVVVLGGAARFAYHGVDRILPGTSKLIAGGGRINLTLRRVTPPDS